MKTTVRGDGPSVGWATVSLGLDVDGGGEGERSAESFQRGDFHYIGEHAMVPCWLGHRAEDLAQALGLTPKSMPVRTTISRILGETVKVAESEKTVGSYFRDRLAENTSGWSKRISPSYEKTSPLLSDRSLGCPVSTKEQEVSPLQAR